MKETLLKLNEVQKDAVINTEGPMLILAGAGSGKTRVVTTKIAYLIKEKNVNPKEILAFTFTNKAANEMKERVANLLNKKVDSMWIGTFHSICVRILRRDINLENYNSNFTIYDTSDQKTVIRECLKELNIDSKILSPNFIQSKISSIKNEGLSIEEYEKTAYSLYDKKIVEIYNLYNQKLKNNNAMDFDDLIIKTIELLEKDQQVRSYYQERFKYVFVDEYQDTNNIQYRLIRLLTDKHRNISVVGDADQSIYKWRGANINNILDFEKDYAGTKKFILSQNYRSTQSILNTANVLINNNSARQDKSLWTENQIGTKPHLYRAYNGDEEASYVIKKIKEDLDSGIPADEIAILYRSNALSRVFEEKLIREGIPYKVIGGIKFYDRAEIKDLIAYLRLSVNYEDDVAFRRIVNSPKRGIGNVTVEKLEDFANSKNLSLLESIEYLEESDNFDKRAKSNLGNFYKIITTFNMKSKILSIEDLTKFIIEKTEYRLLLEKENTIESKSKIENIEEFLTSIFEYEKNNTSDIKTFISDISLLSDVDKTYDNEKSISLMTVHAAKGLEFDSVYIVALEEGIFPSSYAESDDDLEEERRLLYVAITRAKKQLSLSYSKSRHLYGQNKHQIQSQFIEEIINELDELEAIKNHNFKKGLSENRNLFYKENLGIKNLKIEELDTRVLNKKVNYKIGQTVEHKKWGRGVIVSLENTDDDTKIGIQFTSQGLKILLASFAPLKVIDNE